MNWQSPRDLATRLRDQSMADFLAARLCLRLDTFVISGNLTTFAHNVVSKCQQATEKCLKGFLLWHDPSFDPKIGHAPLERILFGNIPGHIQRLINTLNKVDPQLVRNIRWLEDLAPGRLADLAGLDPGKPLPLTVIPKNSEYPFWSESINALVTPAESISMRADGLKAIKTAHALLRTLSSSQPAEYCAPISEFLEVHRISTAPGSWPA
jgi:hypothetical protein